MTTNPTPPQTARNESGLGTINVPSNIPTPQTDSPTPRTDEKSFRVTTDGRTICHVVDTDFARTLERELNDEKEKVLTLTAVNTSLWVRLQFFGWKPKEESIDNFLSGLNGTVETLTHENTSLRGQVERYHDLVRYQRAELHEAGLITDEEYAKLLSDPKSVDRLEGYDATKSQLSTALLANARLVEKELFVRNSVNEITKLVSSNQQQIEPTTCERCILNLCHGILSTNPDTNQNLVVVERGELENLYCSCVIGTKGHIKNADFIQGKCPSCLLREKYLKK